MRSTLKRLVTILVWIVCLLKELTIMSIKNHLENGRLQNIGGDFDIFMKVLWLKWVIILGIFYSDFCD